ncbi:MAG TPA: SMC family ATPase [Candidatus Saccharimonadales bacterium]|nr:SMC family ATPase [Candidatus Saccharimonadales bacterium]
MIPHQLQIKNFLSYGPELQSIDFSNYHLICLTGKNGHGKSALLEAITWAIWGQARKSSGNSKADAGLLHLGQNHMMVILEFEVNGQLYRVRREYLQTKSKPFASLDFGVKQPDGKLIALTDKTIKDTQEKIERTIGITYESFTNSTFLRQGQSNEFSKKSPKERKDILAQILQLQRFDDQKKIALSYAKKLHVEYCAKCSIQQRIELELQALESIAQQYQIINKNLDEIAIKKKDVDDSMTILVEKKQLLGQQCKELELFHNQKNSLEQNLLATKKEIDTIAQPWHQTQKNLIKPFDRKSLEQETDLLQARLCVLQEAFQKKLLLKEEYLSLKEKLTETIQLTEKEFEKTENQLHLLATQYDEALKQTVRQKTTELSHLKNLTADLIRFEVEYNTLLQTITQKQSEIAHYQAIEELFENNKSHYQSLCAQGTYLKQHLQKITHDLEIKASQNCPTCPLCQQNLTPQLQQALHEKIVTENEQTQQQLITIKEEATRLKSDLSKQSVQLQVLKKQHEHIINLSTQATEQNKQHEKFMLQKSQQEKKVQEFEKEEHDLLAHSAQTKSELEKLHTKRQLALQSLDIVKIQKRMNDIEAEAKTLLYNPVEHKTIEEKLLAIRKELESNNQNSDQVTLQTEKKAQLFELFKRAQAITNQIEQLHETLQSYQHLDHQKKDIYARAHELEQNKTLLDQHMQTLLIEKGSLEQKQQKKVALEKELIELVKHIKIVQQEMIDYQEIAKALGKDGIQALLIEQAIPEIEHETNQILARLTNNQTQIFIESLRDLKKGGSRETLDIKISDQFGLRDYELFSGGEAFRIDFALRIGISKLLARRAGTTLQTIFIDEGFGSQDDEGLQLIMDNIYKIQDDFAKIIIVSHLPEMKEQFPVQFMVEKRRSGSAISVIHQG